MPNLLQIGLCKIAENLAPFMGVFKFRQFDDVIKIYLRPTLVATLTENFEF